MADFQTVYRANYYQSPVKRFHQPEGICHALCTRWLRYRKGDKSFLDEFPSQEVQGANGTHTNSTMDADCLGVVSPLQTRLEQASAQDRGDIARWENVWLAKTAKTRTAGFTIITGASFSTIVNSLPLALISLTDKAKQRSQSEGWLTVNWGSGVVDHAVASALTDSGFYFLDPNVGEFHVNTDK